MFYLGMRGYQKLKIGLGVDNFKPMSEICAEVIGFLFRELLNEIVEVALEVKEREKEYNSTRSSSRRLGEITSNEIYESIRLYMSRNNECASLDNSRKKLLFL